MELVDAQLKNEGTNPTNENERTILNVAMRTAIPDAMAQLSATIKHVIYQFRGQGQRHEEKAPHDGASQGRNTKAGSKDEPQVEVAGARGTSASQDGAVMTQQGARAASASRVNAMTTQQPDPAYQNLWENSEKLAKSELPNANADDVNTRAVKTFRMRKKRLKAKGKKGHDQHVVAMRDISNAVK